MAHIQNKAILGGKVVSLAEANMSVASASVLYGLSVYSVVHAHRTDDGFLLFRLSDHITRLKQSAHMIGFRLQESLVDETKIRTSIQELLNVTKPANSQFVRITIHAADLLPGIKTQNELYQLSIFLYDAENILPAKGSRIKTSLWRRTADTAIPARAKVNGAYVNSALAKQDAIDSGYDDCLFLNNNEFVSELSAANIFMIKNKTLLTPDTASDILEGITRRSVIALAKKMNLEVVERKIALTELYTADEVFACGTSAFVSPILELDNRQIGNGAPGALTETLRSQLQQAQTVKNDWAELIEV